MFQFVIASMGSMSLWCHWCLDNFLCFSLSSRTSPFRKHSVLFFSVGLPRTVCAFVSLTRDNIIEQYINTFLETPRPNVIQTASHCCFEKFRIKRYPNRPSLDHPLDLTKSTNHKNGHKRKENSKFRWPLRKHAIKTVFLWLVHFDPLVKKMSDANHLSGPLRKRKFTSTGSKDHCLWLVDFDPFCEFLCFKVRCLWSYCDQNPTLIFQIFLIDFIPGLQTSKFRWGKNTEDSD